MNKQSIALLLSTIISVYSSATVSLSSDTTEQQSATTEQEIELLEEIRDALSDDYSPDDVTTFPETWGHANTLSGLDANQGGGSGLAKYWTGQHQYASESLSKIDLTQIILDTLLVSENAEEEEYLDRYTAVTQSTPARDSTVIQDMRTIARSLDRNLVDLYRTTYYLKERSQSCDAYWKASIDDQASTAIVLDGFTAGNNLPNDFNIDNIEECDRAVCSPSHLNPFNGFSAIKVDASNLNTQLISYCSANSSEACTFIKQLLEQSPLTPSEDSWMTKSMSDDEGKTFLTSLSGQLDGVLAPLQTQLVSAINQQIPTSQYPTTSFSSLYSQPENIKTLTNCTGQISPSAKPNQPNIEQCQLAGSYTDNPALDLYINNLVGIDEILPPIMPGLLSKSSDSTIQVLIAGQYVNFQKQRNGYWKSREQKNSKFLYLPNNQMDGVKSTRESIKNSFYIKRNGFKASVVQSLMAKSSALDIINEIRSMNTKKQHFNVGGQIYSKTPFEILKESSQWRLKSDANQNSWLDEVSTMSNVSLLREVAVLLAEMRQLQYLQLHTSQKQLLIDAIASSKTSQSDIVIPTPIEADLENFSAGKQISKKGPPAEAIGSTLPDRDDG